MHLEKKRRFIINFTYFMLIAILVFLIMKFALPVLAPFVAAIIFAYLLNRPINWCSKKTKVSRKFLAPVFVILFYLILVGLISLIGVQVVTFSIRAVDKLPEFYANTIEPEIQLIIDNLDKIGRHVTPEFKALMTEFEAKAFESIGAMVSSVSIKLVAILTGIAVKVPSVIINVIVMVISTFFLTIDYNKVYGFFLSQFGQRARNIVLQVEYYITHTLLKVIGSYIVIMSITAIELSVGLMLVGINNPVWTAVGIAVFDILPVLGTGGIMLPWVLISLIQERFGRALGLLCVYLIITVVRNILEPKIVGANLSLHPVLTLASMFAGISLFGVIGLFGFPITLSLLKHLNDNGTLKIYRAMDEEHADGSDA